MTRFGATPDDWSHFEFIGLRADLVPCVCNPEAVISPRSALKSVGKIPTIYNAQRNVAGFKDWPLHVATAPDIQRWSREPDYGICIITREVRALDCDITDPELATRVHAVINGIVPGLPERRRDGTSKFLLAFKLEGEMPKRVLRLGGDNKIEFLATGQQFVAVGTHPSGARYTWVGGLPLEIPVLTLEQFEALWAKLIELFAIEPEMTETFKERKAQAGTIDDDRLEFLDATGKVLGFSTEGGVYLTCPFEAGHSTQGDKTETMYLPAGLRDYERGHFKCMHASCAGRSDDDFWRALGYPLLEFDALGPLPDPFDEPVAPAAPEAAVEPAAPAGDLFPLITAKDYANRPLPEYLIEDVLPRGDIAVLYGESGVGKSFIAIDLAFAVARGTDWNGKRVRQGKVLYVAAEGSGGIRNRLRAYAVAKNIDLSDVPFYILPDSPSMLDQNLAVKLTRTALALGNVALVILDTFAQVTAGGNENSSEDMGKALSHCRKIANKINGLVMPVHHAGKDLSRGARGWSGIKAAADCEWEAFKDGLTTYLRNSKQKDGEAGEVYRFSLASQNVDMRDDKVITSCAVEYQRMASGFEPHAHTPAKPKGDLASRIVQVLENAEQGATKQDVIDVLLPTLLPSEDQRGRDRRAERIVKALTRLTDQGTLELDGELIFIAGSRL